MPPPIPVELQAHDPRWAKAADRESQRLLAGLVSRILIVHHVGSTAIPRICAKPILDLIPVVDDLALFDVARPAVEALGYRWHGEYGLPGRRYCTADDAVSGRRRIQLHCYRAKSAEITRHLAFRDYLRGRPAIAQEYERLKAYCRDKHALDSHAYTECKNDWIQRVEAKALKLFDSG